MSIIWDVCGLYHYLIRNVDTPHQFTMWIFLLNVTHLCNCQHNKHYHTDVAPG